MIGALALAAGFTACDDDDVTYDIDGIKEQVVLAPTSNESYKFVKTPSEMVSPEIKWSVAPRTRTRCEEPITVRFEIDNDLIDGYNAENNSEFVALPAGVASLTNAEVTVPEGATVSEDKVGMQLTTDAAQLARLEVGQAYIVPVRMTEVVEGDARIAVSATNISYLTFSVSEEMINDNGNPTGTIVPVSERSGWSGEEGNGASEWYGWDIPIMEGSPYQFGSYPAGSYVTFDFGKEYTFDGLYCYPFYGQIRYSLFCANAELLISSDGDNFTSLGVLSSGRINVCFYAPVTARYLRVVMGNDADIATTAFTIYAK